MSVWGIQGAPAWTGSVEIGPLDAIHRIYSNSPHVWRYAKARFARSGKRAIGDFKGGGGNIVFEIFVFCINRDRQFW